MEKQPRLAGIDLFRGIAAFAVVILHSDEGVKVQSPVWQLLINAADFAVPFFLATSFFLAIRGLCSSDRPYRWKARIERLLIPFYCWSLIYLGWEILRLGLNHKLGQFQELLTEIPTLLILGQAGFAFHLYFIPLLLTGSLVVGAIAPLLRRETRRGVWIAVGAVTLVLYQGYESFLVTLKDNPYEISGFFHFALVLLGYVIRCLPYIAISRLLVDPLFQRRLQRIGIRGTVILGALFVIFNFFRLPLLPDITSEFLQAYSALILGLALSNYLQDRKIISNLSRCSFGIYLMHLLVLNVAWSLIQRLGLHSQLTSVAFLLAIASIVFGLSWMATALLLRQKFLARVLFSA